MYPEWINALPAADVDFPGASARLMSSQHGQVVFWKFIDGGSVPAHRHGPQMGFVLSGCVELTVEGKTTKWDAGSVFCIDDQETHSAVVSPGTRVIEIFQEPNRHVAMG